MNKLIVSSLVMLMSASAFAGEQNAALCRSEAIDGAKALFNLNNKGKGRISVSTELIEMDQSEGGYVVWDVKVKKNNLTYSPYRMTVVIDGCIITRFQMPFAG